MANEECKCDSLGRKMQLVGGPGGHPTHWFGHFVHQNTTSNDRNNNSFT